jgi:uncharacterized SAM-binding protein YcdF (DUF218 family)
LVFGLGVALLGWGEWLNRRWSRMLASPATGGSLAVVALGFRNKGTTANPINRWRVRIAVRSASLADDVTLVFSGGAAHGERPEAELMADYARAKLGFTEDVVLETESSTTWENITNALPLIASADQIVFASQPAHALKARAYVRRQHPELAARLVRGADYRGGEWAPIKPMLALYGLWTLRGLKPDERRIVCPEGQLPLCERLIWPSRPSRSISGRAE